MKAIRAYFREGKLPEPGTVCKTESMMFGDEFIHRIKAMSSEERGLLDAWGKLNSAYSTLDFGLLRRHGSALDFGRR